MAWSLAEVGEFVEATTSGGDGIRLAETVHHPWSLVLACGGAGLAPLRHGTENQLGLGQLSRRTGQREEAREHLASATTLYREMNMRFWLERAAAEMGGLA